MAAAEELEQYSLNGTSLKSYFAEVAQLARDFEYEQALEAAEKAASELMQ